MNLRDDYYYIRIEIKKDSLANAQLLGLLESKENAEGGPGIKDFRLGDIIKLDRVWISKGFEGLDVQNWCIYSHEEYRRANQWKSG